MNADAIINKGCSLGLKSADVITTVECLTTTPTTPTTTTLGCPQIIVLALNLLSESQVLIGCSWSPNVEIPTLSLYVSTDNFNFTLALTSEDVNSGAVFNFDCSAYAPGQDLWFRVVGSDIGRCNDIQSAVLHVVVPGTPPCTEVMLGTVSPDILSADLSCFGEFGADDYYVEYVKGALYYDGPASDSMYLNRSITRGYRITYSSGSITEGPVVDYASYPTASQVQAHNGLARRYFTHTTGPICMQLVDPASFAGHALNGSAPTFRLWRACSPGPTTTTTTTTTVTTTASTSTATTQCVTPCPNDTCIMCTGAQFPSAMRVFRVPGECDYENNMFNIVIPDGNEGHPVIQYCQSCVDALWALAVGEAVYGWTSAAMIACMGSWTYSIIGGEQHITATTADFFGRHYQCSLSYTHAKDNSYCYYEVYDIVRIS